MSLLNREIVQKLFKFVHPNMMSKFEQFLKNFRYGDLWSLFGLLCCYLGSNAVVLNTHIGNFRATWIFAFVKIFPIFKWQSTQLKIWNLFFRFLFHICKSPIITFRIIENVIFYFFTTSYYPTTQDISLPLLSQPLNLSNIALLLTTVPCLSKIQTKWWR